MFLKFLSLFVIFSLVGIGAITLIAFVTHAGCLVQTLQGGGCSANVGSISFFNFHSSAFGQLSLAIFSFFIAFFCAAIIFYIGSTQHNNTIFRTNEKNSFVYFSLNKFMSWLSLYELSPSHIM